MKRVKKMMRIIICVLLVISLTACGKKKEFPDVTSNDNTSKATFTTETIPDNQDVDNSSSVAENGNADPTKIIMIPKETLTGQRLTLEMGNNVQTDSSGTSIVSSTLPTSDKEFTLMIYMVGSTLEYDDVNMVFGKGTIDIEEMIEAGVDFGKINIIVYTGGSLCWFGGIPSTHNCILDISKYNGADNLRSCVVATTEGNPSMGSSETFSKFLDFCYENYPAKEYGLVCWDHGGGPLLGFGMDTRHDGDTLELSEMREALNSSVFSKENKLSFVGFDACLMGCIENAQIWKDYARYLVASEESEPGNGWDYTSLIHFNNSESIEDTLAKITLDSAKSMIAEHSGVTLSVMDLSRTETLVQSLNDLFKSMLTGIQKEYNASVQRIRYKSRGFGRTKDTDYDLVDIYDFADKLSTLYPSESKKVIDDIDEFILCQNTDISAAHGVSIYYPSSQIQYYDDIVSDYYKEISPSPDYTDYLERYYEIWANDSVDGYVNGDDAESTTQYIPEMITFQLSEKQNQNFVSGYYNVYLKNWDDDSLKPVMLHCDIEPDDNGTILVPSSPKLICATSDELEKEVLWMVRQIETNAEHTVYESIGSRLSPGADFDDFSIEDLPINIRINVDNTTEMATIVSITPSEQKGLSNSRETIDLSKWDSISQFSSYYNPVVNADGATLPISEWGNDGCFMGGEFLAVDNELGFELKTADQIDKELVCQVIIQDNCGNIGTSGLVPLNKTVERRYNYPTSYGKLIFTIQGNSAILSDYNGEDEYLEVPSQIDGKAVISIGRNAFSSKSSLKEIVLPECVETIESSAFSYSRNIHSIALPSSLKTIKAYAFSGCSGLENISIPNGVEWIGKSAFSNCETLKEVKLPASIKRIGKAVFTECTNLQKIELSGENDACRMEGNLLMSKDGKTVIAVPAGGGTFIKIPEGVEQISYGAFAGCDELKMIQMPSTLKSIENYAFYNCTGLLSLELPDNLERIGINAFGWSGEKMPTVFDNDPRSEVESISVGGRVDYIGSKAFGCFKCKAIEIADSNSEYASVNGFLTNKAKDYLIMAPSGLEGSVTIPDGIGGLASGLFRHNENLTNVHIPSSVTAISDDAFFYESESGGNKRYNITIYGQSGSEAEKFAKEHGITFISE